MLITVFALNILSVLLSVLLIVSYFIYISYKLLHSCDTMEPEDAKFMKTDRRPGTLDVHPSTNAIILNYEMEVQILGENENVLYSEKTDLKKTIELASLNTRTDCNALAKEVLIQCDLIHPSRLPEVEQLIYYLKKRKLSNTPLPKDGSGDNVTTPTGNNDLDCANINCLNEYIELLYEEVPDKIKGSNLVLQLARDSENLESLSKNEAVLSALARVLREDWKRSIVLSTNLIFTFFCFSTYSCFHHVILNYKIGSLCMDVIDFELHRYDEWKAELLGEQAPSSAGSIKKTCPSSASMNEIRSRIPEPIRPKSGNFSDLNLNKSVMEGSVYDDLMISSTDNIIDSDKKQQISEAEKAKRYRTLIKKQEQLLRVAFYLLLNIAEDEYVEEKMTKKNIVGLLIKTLERDNEDLLVLVVTFLKKLSVMECNKREMTEKNVVEKLPKLLKSENPDLVHLTLKLLFNFSFDVDMRSKMVKIGFLPKFVSLLCDDKQQDVVIKILYHLSYEDNVKSMFAYTECVSLIIDMLLLCRDDKVDPVMIALCINLAINKNNAHQMIENNRLHNLMSRAFRYQDPMLMKMIHNIAEHKTIRPAFIEFVGDLAKVVVESKNPDFVIECVGVLANLNMPDLDWAEIFKHFNLIPWIRDVVKPNGAEPDMVLQVVVLLGIAALDEGCAQLLCKSDLLLSLIELLKAQQEDDEIVLQIIYVFLVILTHDNAIDYVISETEAPAYLIDLLQDNNKSIRKVCNTCLNIISERNAKWCTRIRIERFRNHNSQWLQMVDSNQADEQDEEEDDTELPPYMNTDYLSTAVVPTLSEYKMQQQNLHLNPSEEFVDLDGDRPGSRLDDFEVDMDM